MRVTAKDSKGRIVILLKENGDVLFQRYPDMIDEDKKRAKEVFLKLEKEIVLSHSLDDLEKFLNYEDNKEDICG